MGIIFREKENALLGISKRLRFLIIPKSEPYMFQIILDSLQFLQEQVDVDHVCQDEESGHGGQEVAGGTDLKQKKREKKVKVIKCR